MFNDGLYVFVLNVFSPVCYCYFCGEKKRIENFYFEMDGDE